MQKKIRLLAFWGLFLLCGAALAQGTGPTDRESTDMALDRTDQIIEQAVEAVRESGSLRARNLLEAAMSLQKKAKNMLRGMVDYGLTDQQVSKYTFSARTKAEQAIAITRQAEENEDYVRRRLEITEEMIGRLEESADGSTPENVKMVLEKSSAKMHRARELFRNRRLKMALQLSLQTQKSLEKLVEQVSGYMKSQSHMRSFQERYYTLLDRIESSGPADGAEIKSRLRKAEELRVRAEKLADKGRLVRAEKTMQEAVEALSRVAEMIREPIRIRSSLEHLEQRLEETEQQVRASDNRQVLEMYNNAREHWQKAEVLYRDGKYEAAAARLQAARQILARIGTLLGG